MIDFSMFGDEERGKTPYWMSLKKMDDKESRVFMMLLMDVAETGSQTLSSDAVCDCYPLTHEETCEAIIHLIYTGHLTLAVTPSDILESRWQRDKEENDQYLKEHPEYGCAD